MEDPNGEHDPEQPNASSGAEPSWDVPEPQPPEQAHAPTPAPGTSDAASLASLDSPVGIPAGTGSSTPDTAFSPDIRDGQPPPWLSPNPPIPVPPQRRRGRAILLVALSAILLAGAVTGITAALATGQRTGQTHTPGTMRTYSVRQAIHLTTAQVARLVNPAVVDINTTVQLTQGTAEAAGTGMFITHDGYIVTNNHVVAGATSIEVTIQGRPGRLVARFIGSDPLADVAVIKVDVLSPVPIVQFGNSSALALGEPVVAIGNALGLGGTPTVTSGTISALDRAITASDDAGTNEHLSDMIQTDAPIEPGNSGGPLVDTTGHVVGMNTAAASADGARSTSLGFALPINRVVRIATQIEAAHSGGGVEMGLPAFLGIDGQNVDLLQGAPAKSGVDILGVLPGTPAAKAGIVPGDIIIAFDGSATPTISSLSSLIHRHRPGQHAVVKLDSGSGVETVGVDLAPGPAG